MVISFSQLPELWGGDLIHSLPRVMRCQSQVLRGWTYSLASWVCDLPFSFNSFCRSCGRGGGDLIHFSPEQKGTSFSCLFCNIFISKRYIFIYFFLKFLFIFYEVLFQILCKYFIPAKFSYFILYIQIVIFLYFSLINFTFHLYSTVAFYCLNSFII